MYGILLDHASPLRERGELRILGARFFVRRLSPRPTHTECALLARLMRRRGVRLCVFPRDFPRTGTFAGQGVYPVDTDALLRRKAAELTLKRRRDMDLRGGVAVLAERLSSDVEETLLRLAPHVRTLALNGLCGRKDFCAELMYQHGIALEPIRAENAETQLFFSSPHTLLPPAALSVMLYGKNKPALCVSEKTEKHLPQGVERTPLLETLRLSGALREEEIFPA